MSGTDAAYGTVCRRRASTDVAYGNIRRGSGAATSRSQQARRSTPLSAYALSGTDLAYDATRCPVLIRGMLLRAVRFGGGRGGVGAGSTGGLGEGTATLYCATVSCYVHSTEAVRPGVQWRYEEDERVPGSVSRAAGSPLCYPPTHLLCPVRYWPDGLCYAIAHTDTVHTTHHLYAMLSTIVCVFSLLLRTCYAMSGTEIGAPTPS
eukprot:1784044-Rhodomonas_salina.2